MNEYLNSVKNVKKLDTKIYTDYGFNVTNFSYDDTLNNIFFCLLYTGIIKGYNESILEEYDLFDRQIIRMDDKLIIDIRNELLKHFNEDEYNYPFSKKKMLQLVASNQYNHELLLILADKYNINIFIFFKDINIFKVYYPEDKLNKTKDIIFLQYSNDTYSSSNTFQIMSKNNNKLIFAWSDVEKMINENISNIYPIGIDENKSFVIDDKSEKACSLYSKKNNENIVNISSFIMKKDEIDDIPFYNSIVKS